jgi:hypothetical protein
VLAGNLSVDPQVQSRDMLVHAQRKLVECLVNFVKGNPRNQAEVMAHLPELRPHLGLLQLPVWPEDFSDGHKARCSTSPGLNAEEVVIECLRGNLDVCQTKVPRDLLEEFGLLMDAEPDPSACSQLELFQLMCLPDGPGTKAVPRNQSMVLDVLLSDRLRHLRACVNNVFFSEAPGEKPERLVLLLAATICDSNLKTAAQLQSKKISIEATVAKMHTTLVAVCLGSYQALSDRGRMGREAENAAVSGHPLFNALLVFLAEQFQVLVVRCCGAAVLLKGIRRRAPPAN